MTLQFWGKLFKGIFVESRDSMLRTTSTVLPVFLYYSRRSFRPDDTPFQLSSSTSSFEMDFVWRYIVNIHFPFQCQYFPTYSSSSRCISSKNNFGMVYVIHFISWHMSKSWKKNLFEKRLVLTSAIKVDIRKGPWLSLLSFGALAFNRLNSTVCWIDLDLSCSSRSRENVSSLLGRVIGCNVKASLIQ